MSHSSRPDSVHLVTQARPSLSDDIAYRQRRYLVMMGIRAVCFFVAVVMFVNHLGWFSLIPAVGAIIIPYFAVVFANGGREPSNTRGFVEYQVNLPVPHDPSGPGGGSSDGTTGSGNAPDGPSSGPRG